MPAFLAFMIAGIKRLLLARRQEDQVDALRDHAVDVGSLLGGRAGGIRVDELVAELLGLRPACSPSGPAARDCCFRSARSRPCRCPSWRAAARPRRPAARQPSTTSPADAVKNLRREQDTDHHSLPVVLRPFFGGACANGEVSPRYRQAHFGMKCGEVGNILQGFQASSFRKAPMPSARAVCNRPMSMP